MNAEDNIRAGQTSILVVEDDLTQAFLIKQFLSSRGYAVHTAEDGVQAMEVLGKERVDLVISDVDMPAMDGYQLCEAIKADPRFHAIPVILLTMLNGTGDLLRGLKAKAEFYLPKPFDPTYLVGRIEELLREGTEITDRGDNLYVHINGERHVIDASRRQMVNLLLSTYDCVLQQNHELKVIKEELNSRNHLLKEQANLLKASESNFRALLEHQTDGILVIDADGRVRFVNPAAQAMLEITDVELVGKPFTYGFNFRNPGEVLLCRRRSDALVVEFRADETVWEGKPASLVSMRDITQRKDHERRILEQQELLRRANAKLQALANTDGLTGLTNHRVFQERLVTDFQPVDAPSYISLVLIDVDSFKQYNDSFGHQAGDEVLRSLATILTSTIRGSDLVARYGGEEFVLLLPDTDASKATALAERLRRSIEAATWRNRQVTASLGVATRLRGDGTPAELIAEADRALYHSKQTGRNRVSHSMMLERAKAFA